MTFQLVYVNMMTSRLMFAREKIRRSTNTEDICHGEENKYLVVEISRPLANKGLKLATHVESDVDPNESEVTPMVAIKDIRIRLQELVCRPVRAELATARRVWIRYIASKIVDELAQVLLTSLTRGWFNSHIFDGCAGDLGVPDS